MLSLPVGRRTLPVEERLVPIDKLVEKYKYNSDDETILNIVPALPLVGIEHETGEQEIVNGWGIPIILRDGCFGRNYEILIYIYHASAENEIEINALQLVFNHVMKVRAGGVSNRNKNPVIEAVLFIKEHPEAMSYVCRKDHFGRADIHWIFNNSVGRETLDRALRKVGLTKPKKKKDASTKEDTGSHQEDQNKINKKREENIKNLELKLGRLRLKMEQYEALVSMLEEKYIDPDELLLRVTELEDGDLLYAVQLATGSYSMSHGDRVHNIMERIGLKMTPQDSQE